VKRNVVVCHQVPDKSGCAAGEKRLRNTDLMYRPTLSVIITKIHGHTFSFLSTDSIVLSETDC
jgi:hypothetical protein